MSSSTSVQDHQGEYNGEPGCKTLSEVSRMFQHYWDPTAYWQCEAQGKPATLSRCATSELFSNRRGQCVHYTEWEWAEPTEPPSRPNTN